MKDKTSEEEREKYNKYHREYSMKPKNKKYRAEYYQRPKIKKKHAEYEKERRKNLEVKAYHDKYAKTYREMKKKKKQK